MSFRQFFELTIIYNTTIVKYIKMEVTKGKIQCVIIYLTSNNRKNIAIVIIQRIIYSWEIRLGLNCLYVIKIIYFIQSLNPSVETLEEKIDNTFEIIL